MRLLSISIIILLVAALGASAGAAGAAEAKKVEADSKITAVTVYAEGAMITRTTKVKLEAGAHEIIFAGLPAYLPDDSLRSGGRGPGEAKILGISVERVFSERATTQEVRTAEDKLVKLRDEQRELQDKLANLKIGEDFLRQIKAVAPEKISRDIVMHEMKVEEYSKMLQFMMEGLGDIQKKQRESEIALRDLAPKINVAERELYQMRNKGGKEHKKVSVGFETAKAGEYEVSLSYRLYDVSWHPVYDVRANVETGEMELSYYGMVYQRTGEDWDGVEVTLSTARANLGARMPELQPWLLGAMRNSIDSLTVTEASGANKNNSMSALRFSQAKNQATDGLYVVERSNEFAGKPAIMLTAQAESRGTSVAFTIGRKENIKSDGRPHKTTISVEEFKPELEYWATPKLSQNAYLSAKITNNTDKPFLPGEVYVYLGGDYVGTSRLDFVAQNEEFKLFLGMDEGIKIKREMDNMKSVMKESNKRKVLDFAYEIEIHNLKKKAIKLTVIDQIPVSQNKDIKVRNTRFDPKATKEENNGLVKWELNLIGGEKRKIMLEFTIDYPNELVVTGEIREYEQKLYDNMQKQQSK